MTGPEPQPPDLVARAAAGDDVALENLVRAYHDRVYRFGLRVCRDGFDADDAVQQAFVKLARRPDVMRDRSALSWLMTVVRNSCLRMLRPFSRQRRHLGDRVELEEEASPGAIDPERSLERFELVAAVHAAIARLEPNYREVLVLRDLEGLSGAETCRALGIQLSTMKTRLHRARQSLRAHLDGDGFAQRRENPTEQAMTPAGASAQRRENPTEQAMTPAGASAPPRGLRRLH